MITITTSVSHLPPRHLHTFQLMVIYDLPGLPYLLGEGASSSLEVLSPVPGVFLVSLGPGSGERVDPGRREREARTTGSGVLDLGSGVRDLGCGLRERRSGDRLAGLGPFWMEEGAEGVQRTGWSGI